LALASFLQLLRPQTLEDQRAQRVYVASVRQLTDRLQTMFADWRDLRAVEPDYTRLANAAAVQRWELMRLVKDTEQFDPPRAALSIQRDVLNCVVGAARACQLLANGYRAHTFDAICDGQALLIETVDELTRLLARLQMR
jgi:hypothetical protein